MYGSINIWQVFICFLYTCYLAKNLVECPLINSYMEGLYQKFAQLLAVSNKILIISHRKPDGDTLGASCSIYDLCLNMGKNPTLACVDTPSDRFSFLSGIKTVVKEFDFKDFDLITVSDAGAHYMTQYHEIYPDIFSGVVPVVNIDHHLSNDDFGTLNIVDIESASTTVLLYKMYKFLGFTITPSMATSLLAGIYNDTGSFMHSNTTSNTYEVASDLLSLGGQIAPIVNNMFNKIPISTMKVWGKVLDNIQINTDGVVMSVMTEDDFAELSAHPEQVSGVIDYLNAVPGAKFSMLVNEDGKGNIKGSMRTQSEDVDLSEIAGLVGGGGHAKASGFSFPGKIVKETTYKIISSDEKSSGALITNNLLIEPSKEI